MKSIEFLIKDGLKLLKQRDYNNPSLDIQLILMYLLKKDRIFLYSHKDDLVDEKIIKIFYEMLEKRDSGYPLQYMLNTQEFMGLEFYVEEGVLVPRPDTETLVEKIINIAKTECFKNKKTLNILDIGTGSGAIALSLAHYIENSNITAIDISDIAINVANINKERLNLKNVNIVKADLFAGLDFDFSAFDIIVSNPPYIESEEIDNLQIEVARYEPRLALDGGRSGLIYYEKIKELADGLMSSPAVIALEIGHNQALLVADMFRNLKNVKSIEIDKDLYANDRLVTVCFE